MRTRAILILVAIAMGLMVSGSDATTGAVPPRFFVPPEIDPTGAVDVTSALNAYLLRVSDGSTVVFPAQSRYRIEGTLRLENRRNIVIEGQGATFFATTDGLNQPAPGCDTHYTACRYPNRMRAQWSFRKDTNIIVRNVNVIGSATNTGPSGAYDPALEAQHGFSILDVSGIVLYQVSAHHVWGDLVYVGAGSKYVIVANSRFHSSSRMGWAITRAQYVAFVNNSVYSARRSLIDIEANTSDDRIAYITIRNNRLGASRFCTLTNHGAASVQHHFVIADNQAMGTVSIKICIEASPTARRRNYEISGNVGATGTVLRNEPMVGIAYVDNVTVTGNVQGFSAQWPWRGSPEAPVVSTCSTVVAVTANRFTPRPAGMPEYIARPC
jgi:hypothetical protein